MTIKKHQVDNTEIITIDTLKDGVNVLNKLDATADPTSDDDSGDGYSVGSKWINVTDDRAFICVDSSVGSAVWRQIDSSTLDINNTQSDDDQPTVTITHDFNSYEGSAVYLETEMSGDGIGDTEYISGYESSVNKVVTSTKYYYVMNASYLTRKVGTEDWANVSLPGTPSSLKFIHGSSLNNIWVCGSDSSGNGYIARDSGSGFALDTSHPLQGTSSTTFYGVTAFSDTEVWVFVIYSSTQRIYKWNGSSWSNKYTPADEYNYRGFAKVGNCIALPGKDRIYYSLDNGENWSQETTQWSGASANIDIGTNPVTGHLLVIATKDYGEGYYTAKLWEGLPEGTGEDSWTEIGQFDLNGTTVSFPYSTGDVLYTDPVTGAAYVILTVSGTKYLVYNWSSGAPDSIALTSSRGISGTSGSNVAFVSGSYTKVGVWNGSSVLDLGSVGVTGNIQTWTHLVPNSSADFENFRGGFTGTHDSGRAVVFKGGAGATHVLHAETGVITLTNVEDDPVTEATRGSHYVKGGEFYFKDASGNVVQLTDSGDLALLTGVNVLNKFDATSAPTSGDDSGDGYSVGSKWIDVTHDAFYICVDSSVGSAMWIPIVYDGDLKLNRSKITVINSSTHDVDESDEILHVTYTATDVVTITVPSALITAGIKFSVKDAGNNAGTKNITIETQDSETIDGSSSYVISTNSGKVTLYSDGSNLFTL